MEYLKKQKRRLNKLGKICFGILFLCIISLGMLCFSSKNSFHEKKETDQYLIEIDYPKLKNENLKHSTDRYIKEKKEQFIKQAKSVGTMSSKYEFKTDYEVIENDQTLGVHVRVFEYTGGAHYIREDKSYYYDKKEDKMITILDILEKDTLDRLASLVYYYVMKYSQDQKLDFDSAMVKSGLTNKASCFEHFKLMDKGLEFTFPPYQVAPYAAGEIKVIIPYQELIGIVKKEYLKLDEKEQKPIRNLKEFSDKKLIAFTFDDGPSMATSQLLDHLDEFQARVTFFVVGNRVSNYSDILKRAYDMGNLIGSHTYSHQNLFQLDSYEIINDLKKTNENIKQITEQDTVYLRPPYGNINEDIMRIADMHVILWDLDTEDWKYKNKDIIADYIVKHAHDGAIILLHDLYETSVQGALQAMKTLKKEGYAFVTIEEMAKLKNITLDKESCYHHLKNS